MIRTGITLIGLLLLAWSSEAQTLNLTETQRAAFSKMALEKTAALSNYIATLCDKSSPEELKQSAMGEALDLFRDHERIVQVSSKNSNEIRSVNIERYLNHLRVLRYTSVEIEWYDVNYVSEVKKGVDGKYYGTITIFQKFIGRNGEQTYEDVTQKNIGVVLEIRTKRIGDRVVEGWMVLLGDIEVVETR